MSGGFSSVASAHSSFKFCGHFLQFLALTPCSRLVLFLNGDTNTSQDHDSIFLTYLLPYTEREKNSLEFCTLLLPAAGIKTWLPAQQAVRYPLLH